MSGHVLVIESQGEDPVDSIWHVEHPAGCPTETFDAGMLNEKYEPMEYRTCGVQFSIDHIGLDDLDGWHKLAPGRYPIDFHSNWTGSMFDDAEAYIYFVPTGERV